MKTAQNIALILYAACLCAWSYIIAGGHWLAAVPVAGWFHTIASPQISQVSSLSAAQAALVFAIQRQRPAMHDTQALTECIQRDFEFQGLGPRKVVADFSGGHLSSDGGVLLLRELDARLGVSAGLAGCFTDLRSQEWVEHPLPVLVAQRLYGLALGYEDVNDHDRLRLDPLFAAACGREDLLGEQRRLEADRGKPLAGKSTLNRLELGAREREGHYRKIQPDPERIEDLLVDMGVKSIRRKSRVIVIDLDATDDPVHGGQEGRFFHGYYKSYCYLPLYAFCGDIPLWAQLRKSDRGAAEGSVEALKKMLRAIRRRFGRKVAVIVRGDSGFSNDELMSWIEARRNVYYCFGQARNARLERMLEPSFDEVLEELGHPDLVLAAQAAGADKVPGVGDLEGSARRFADLRYRTLKSWSRERRLIGKAEITNGKRNPRYIVTNIRGNESWARGRPEYADARALYEEFYCARGDMENRIKEQQLDLFADRTSTRFMASNQLRLWMSTFAYLLMSRLRALALAGTRLERASAGSIRIHLLKIAAQVTVSVRRVYVRLASACPAADVFAAAQARLRMLPACRGAGSG